MKPEILHEDSLDESEKNVAMVFFISGPFMVKMQSKKYFCIFFQEIQAKINEL